MKIDIKDLKNSSNEPKKDVKSILIRTLLVSVILLVGFVVAIKLIEAAEPALASDRFNTTVEISDAAGRVGLQSPAYSVTYAMQNVVSDNYLHLLLSGHDVYKVAFSNDKDSDYIIINTSQTDDIPFLYFIPDGITEMGYSSIVITPMSGDGEYWAQDVSLCSNPDFNAYPDCTIVDYEIRKLEITISPEDMEKIEQKRDEALKLGILIADDSDYVTATVSADGKIDKAEVRLKGDWTDHLAGDKWSFRVKLNEDCFWGMNKFSIQPPETRHEIGEYLIQNYYREQGGVYLRYDFIDVIINGEYKGVYALEEFFNKRAIENSLKREGPIININEDYLWEHWAYYMASSHGLMDYSNVEVFSQEKTLQSDMLSGYAEYAVDNLSRFIRGEIPAADVFDLKLYAKYLAVMDVFQSEHGSTWQNMRYYFNPITAKLEPIPFDELTMTASVGSSKRIDPIMFKLFQNEELNDLYVQDVRELLDGYQAFIERYADDIAKYTYILQRDNIVCNDYSTVLDEYQQTINDTFSYDNTEFYGEINGDNQLVITRQNDGFFNGRVTEVTLDGLTLRFAIRYDGAIIVPSESVTADYTWSDRVLNSVRVTYETIFDKEEHIKSLSEEQDTSE